MISRTPVDMPSQGRYTCESDMRGQLAQLRRSDFKKMEKTLDSFAAIIGLDMIFRFGENMSTEKNILDLIGSIRSEHLSIKVPGGKNSVTDVLYYVSEASVYPSVRESAKDLIRNCVR